MKEDAERFPERPRSSVIRDEAIRVGLLGKSQGLRLACVEQSGINPARPEFLSRRGRFSKP